MSRIRPKKFDGRNRENNGVGTSGLCVCGFVFVFFLIFAIPVCLQSFCNTYGILLSFVCFFFIKKYLGSGAKIGSLGLR